MTYILTIVMTLASGHQHIVKQRFDTANQCIRALHSLLQPNDATKEGIDIKVICAADNQGDPA